MPDRKRNDKMPVGVILPNVISFSSHLVVFQEVVSANYVCLATLCVFRA